jgi:hypothetical protein
MDMVLGKGLGCVGRKVQKVLSCKIAPKIQKLPATPAGRATQDPPPAARLMKCETTSNAATGRRIPSRFSLICRDWNSIAEVKRTQTE